MLHITLKEFRCWKNLTIDIPLGEVTLIKGASGCGKSTILQAIVWCLYGKIQLVLEMVLVDKKILSGGLVMISIGIILTITFAEQPLGQSGMTEEEIIDLMIAEDENQAYQLLSGIFIGIGFLLVLISFGARRKKDSVKRTEKKPTEQ